MKNRKPFLMALISILYFCIILQGLNTFSNEQDDKDNKNIVPLLSASNSDPIEWNRTWGGSDWDYSVGVAVDSFYNVYIAGGTDSFGAGDYDIVLVKYDSSGVQQWNRTWGGSDYDSGRGVAVDSSDSVYIAGITESFGVGFSDMVLVKYDSSGVQLWNRTWGGSSWDEGYGVTVDSSNNVYLAGYTESFGAGSSDMVLVKFDRFGVQQWNRTWGGSEPDDGWGVAVDSFGNVYLAGTTLSFGARYVDMVLVKYDSSGVQQWNRTWGGIDYDSGNGVAVDSSNNVYLAGYTESFGAGFSDIVLVKYDSSGVQQWNRTWGGNDYDLGFGVAVDSSYNVYLAGGTDSFGTGSVDMVLVKYDSSGVQQWNRTWGGSNSDYGWGVAVDSSYNVYLAGETESFGVGFSDTVLVKYIFDISKPLITINSPSPDDKFGDKAPDYDILIVEPNLESMWYTIDLGLTNYSIIQLSGTINQSAWDDAPYGNITIEFYAKDLAENIGYSEVIVEKLKGKKEPAIPGYNLLFLISLISIITVVSLHKKYNK